MSKNSTNADAASLAGEIETAVAQALAECGRSAAWRAYAGKYQSDLIAALQQLSGCEHVGLASSGTAALEMVLTACRLQPGDEVLLSGYDYPGTFAAIERVGGRPALVDVAERSWNLCWDSLEATVTPACRALVVSHLHGLLQPMARLERWCAEREIWLIQDACQVLGAALDGRSIGQFGDATIFSFGGGKTISAGRGGAWASQNASLAQHARIAAGVGSGTHEMSELQAAVVLAQLPFLARITERCRTYFAQTRASLCDRFPALEAPWEGCLAHTAFYQAGWLLPYSGLAQGETTGRNTSQLARIEAQPLAAHSHPDQTNRLGAEDVAGSLEQLGLSQSQRAEGQRIGIGSGFQGYHRRSRRRCRVAAPLQNTARVAQATVTVHYRAALLDAPVVETVAQWIVNGSSQLG